jgi:hypothetical protein
MSQISFQPWKMYFLECLLQYEAKRGIFCLIFFLNNYAVERAFKFLFILISGMFPQLVRHFEYAIRLNTRPQYEPHAVCDFWLCGKFIATCTLNITVP